MARVEFRVHSTAVLFVNSPLSLSYQSSQLALSNVVSQANVLMRSSPLLSLYISDAVESQHINFLGDSITLQLVIPHANLPPGDAPPQ